MKTLHAAVLGGMLLFAAEALADQPAGPTAAKTDDARQVAPSPENPFALANVIHWLLAHVPKILATLLAIVVAQFVVRRWSQRVVKLMTRQPFRAGLQERENRAATLASVLRNTASVAIIVSGVLMILDELSISIGPLLGSAAVIGLAVAFGTQNLIKDYFTGFMLLLEDQYGVNDVVKIGGVSGSVERITLRTTVLRDLEGTVHFIPHGSITTVSNLTHDWSRAVFEVRVAYTEDVDRVIAALTEVGKSLREDSEYNKSILDDLQMLGVDQLGETAVILKFFIKTVPLQQWKVKREMLRRVKKKFDESAIGLHFANQANTAQSAGVQPRGSE